LSWFPQSWGELARRAFMALASCVLIAASVVLLRSEMAVAAKLRRELTPAPLGEDRLKIIRSPGDEASGAISIFQFISGLTVRLFFGAQRAYDALLDGVTKYKDHRLAFGLGGVSGCVVDRDTRRGVGASARSGHLIE